MTLQTFAMRRPRPSASGEARQRRAWGATPMCLQTCVLAWLGFRPPDSPRDEKIAA
jgi:hypothetical protein